MDISSKFFFYFFNLANFWAWLLICLRTGKRQKNKGMYWRIKSNFGPGLFLFFTFFFKFCIKSFVLEFCIFNVRDGMNTSLNYGKVIELLRLLFKFEKNESSLSQIFDSFFPTLKFCKNIFVFEHFDFENVFGKD